MTATDLMGRVDRVERDMYEMGADVRVLKSDVSSMKGDIIRIGDGVRELISRDAKRPEPVSGKTMFGAAVGTAAGMAAIWTVVTFLIASSEPVGSLRQSISKVEHRLERIDDPRDGKIAILEGRVTKTEHWITSVTPSPTIVTVTPSRSR